VLCQQAGDIPELFIALHGLRVFYTNRGELLTAHHIGEQCLRLAAHLHDPPHLLQAHFGLGATLFYRGELARASEHLRQGIAIALQPSRSAALEHTMRVHGTDTMLRSHAAWVLWLRGYPDQALHSGHEALRLAQEVSHPYYLVMALNQSARLHQFRRDVHLTQARAEAAIALGTEHGFTFYSAMGAIFRGWALAVQEPAEDGIVQLQQGLAAWRATGAELSWPQWLALLAEAYRLSGHASKGVDALAEAIRVASNHGEAFYAAELHRLMGECVLQSTAQAAAAAGQGRAANAEGCFRQALATARHQQAKAWELLAPVYHWFTEGFDTADLQEAKVLLEALGV
jgi:predicted ATPase